LVSAAPKYLVSVPLKVSVAPKPTVNWPYIVPLVQVIWPLEVKGDEMLTVPLVMIIVSVDDGTPTGTQFVAV